MALIKNVLGPLLLVLVSLGIGVGAVEVGLRILPSSLTGIRSDVRLVADEAIAFKRMPNQQTRLDSACFSVPVSINNVGFRDTNWTEDQPIVILGDSYTEALQVGDKQNFAALLEEITDVKVANLGRSSFGTVGELAAFKAYGAALKPKIVLLMVYADNDIDDNNCAISQGPNGTVTKPCGDLVDDSTVFRDNFYSTSGNHALRSFIREQCTFCTLLKGFLSRQAPSPIVSLARENVAQYLPRGTAGVQIEESWRITEAALQSLKTEVEVSGAELVLVTVPSVLEYSYDPVASMSARFGGAQVPKDLAVSEPNNRLHELATKLKVPFVPLQDAFIDYRDAHQLPEPLFSYRCDGHWNPIGHAVAAAGMVELVAQKSVVFRALISDTAQADAGKLLSEPPVIMVGQSGMDAIYSGGVYVLE